MKKIDIFLDFKRWILSIFNPPYQLTLSDKIIDPVSKKTIYVFKQYGSHDYIKIKYSDIVDNQSILSAINPINLTDIHLAEHLSAVESRGYKITESLRGGNYKIASGDTEEIYSGEYICKNIDMFESIATSDICKIAYSSGFDKGRKISLEIKEIVADIEIKDDYREQENIIKIDSYR